LYAQADLPQFYYQLETKNAAAFAESYASKITAYRTSLMLEEQKKLYISPTSLLRDGSSHSP
jgi:hypothetical protein